MFESDVRKERNTDAGIEQLHGYGLLKTVCGETNETRETHPPSLRLKTFNAWYPKKILTIVLYALDTLAPRVRQSIAAAAKSSASVTIALPGSSDGNLG